MSYPTPLVKATTVARDSDVGGATPYTWPNNTCTDVQLMALTLLSVSGFAGDLEWTPALRRPVLCGANPVPLVARL